MTYVIPEIDGVLVNEYFTLAEVRKFAHECFEAGAEDVNIYRYNTRTGAVSDEPIEVYDRACYDFGSI